LREEYSATSIKIQEIKLIGNFKLIEAVMQMTFDCLHDMADVEQLYKTHCEK
jgi:hypothetical protein